MSLPFLLRKLFQNDGAGEKLNVSVIPTLDAYVPKSGTTMNSGSQISRVTNAGAWIYGRSVAMIKTTTAPNDSWGAVVSCKSNSGSYELGTLGDKWYLTYASDSYYNAGTNSVAMPIVADTSGNVTVANALQGKTVKATSDKRLKEDFTVKHYDLSSLKIYRYKFKEQEGYHVGLIAQEVQNVIPEAVSEGEDGYLALDYNAVVAALVEEVNTLKERINKLEKKA
jgi:hypothetical protein